MTSYRGSYSGKGKKFSSGSAATQPPTQWVMGFFPRGKAGRDEVNYSPPPTANVKNVWGYTTTPAI
jgi:hypothetical protein